MGLLELSTPLFLTFIVTTSSTADQGGSPLSTTDAPAPLSPAPTGALARTERPLPDYDGRGPRPTTLGDAALVVPRVMLLPVWLVAEYFVRRPIGWLVETAEANQWPKVILDFFTYGDARTAGVFPTVLFDFGFRPSVGVYAFWDDLFFGGSSARLHAAYGGRRWYAIRLNERVTLAEKSRLALTLGASRRPDLRFEGTGPTPPNGLLGRYENDRLEAQLSFESPIGEAGFFSIHGGAKRVIFHEGGCCDDPSLGDLIGAGLLDPPPGYGQTYATWEHGASVEWDSRRPRPAPGHGVRLELNASQTFGLGGTIESPWVAYGGALGGFVDLTGRGRVLSLSLSAKLLEAIDHDGRIPFTELLTLGGPGALPGFRPGALLGESQVAAQLEYRWPIWVFFDGTMHLGLGNVFGRRLEGFDPRDLRMSFGIGVRTIGRPDHAFNVIAAAGTDTFGRGATINTFRLTIGTSRGF